MSLKTLFKKEMKDSISKFGVIFIILIMIIAWVVVFFVVNLDDTLNPKKVKIGLIDLDNTELSSEVNTILSQESNLVYSNTSFDDAIESTRENNGIAVLVIEKGFSDLINNNTVGIIKIYWIIESYGAKDMETSREVMLLIDSLRYNMSKVLIPNDSPINSTIIMNSISINETIIFKGEMFENVSVDETAGFIAFFQIAIPSAMLMIMFMLGGSVVTSISKERNSDMLETLISFPVKRRNIIISKILSCIVSMFIYMTILMVGVALIFKSIESKVSEPTNGGSEGNIGFNLSFVDYFLFMSIMLIAILTAIALYSFSAMFTSSNNKSIVASIPLYALFIIPTGILIMFDFSTLSTNLKFLLSIIPGSHLGIAINSIINKNYALAIASITYLALFSIVMFIIVIKLFKTDRVVS